MERRRLNSLLLSFVAGVLASVSVPARSEEAPEYRGTVFITEANATCVELGYPVGTFFGFALRLQPRPSNNDGGGLLLNSPTLAWTYLLPDGVPLPQGKSKGTFAGLGISSHVGSYDYSSDYRLKVRVTGTSVSLDGEIDTFNGDEGCTATIRGAGTLRVYFE